MGVEINTIVLFLSPLLHQPFVHEVTGVSAIVPVTGWNLALSEKSFWNFNWLLPDIVMLAVNSQCCDTYYFSNCKCLLPFVWGLKCINFVLVCSINEGSFVFRGLV